MRITCQPDIFLLAFYNYIMLYYDINYQLNPSIYVAIGGHCYATLIKTDIHLIAFNRLAFRKTELTAVTLMTSSKTREPELKMITRDFYSIIKHHSDNEQTLQGRAFWPGASDY